MYTHGKEELQITNCYLENISHLILQFSMWSVCTISKFIRGKGRELIVLSTENYSENLSELKAQSDGDYVITVNACRACNSSYDSICET